MMKYKICWLRKCCYIINILYICIKSSIYFRNLNGEYYIPVDKGMIPKGVHKKLKNYEKYYIIILAKIAILPKGKGVYMKVSSTEIQNNFGHYLLLAAKEPVTITKNGTTVAQLTSLINYEKNNDLVAETRLTSKYIYGGREASYEEFLKLTENNEERYEYIDGEIYALASPVTRHQLILQGLYRSFFNYFQGKDSTVMLAPYDITLKRTEEDTNVVQPDLMVICDLEDKLDERDYYMGIPTMVVEIISNSTRSKDMVKKLDLYMKCGIKEYWLIEPYKEEVFTYLFKDKEIEDVKTYHFSDVVSSFTFKELKVDLNEI